MSTLTVPSLQDAAWQQIVTPGTDNPQFQYAFGAPLEIFDFSPDWPIGAVDTYPDPLVVDDPVAYSRKLWDFPLEVFNIEGVVHADWQDATAPSNVGIGVQNLSAPLPAIANVAGYGLDG